MILILVLPRENLCEILCCAFILNTGGGLDWSRICQKSSKVCVFLPYLMFDFGCPNIKSPDPKIHGEQYVDCYQNNNR